MAVDSGAVRAPAGALYARFSRRLRGVLIDFMLFLVAMVVALQIAVAFDSSDLARVIGFSFMVGYFLYEPLLVSIFGGTIGHYLSNMRVVDDRTRGNVSFLKAVARAVIKAVLSWYSFISMATARRHQAVHDLLTRSTVQVRDPAKALPSHYARERVELSSPDLPSRWRRTLVIAGYLLLLCVVSGVVMVMLIEAGVFSEACMDHPRQRCSAGELVLLNIAGLSVIGLMTLCLGLGWRGRLWGARRRAEST
jgi:RDD family protein